MDATISRELETSVTAGGVCFCGVTAEKFAINGTRYQWPRGSKLAWGIGFSRLGQLTDMDVKDALAAVFAEISAACDLQFEFVKNFKQANLQYLLAALDGPSGVLAQMQIPVGNVSADRTVLTCEFDDGDSFVNAENPPRGSVDFYRVSLHETLHGLGLGHEPASIKKPSIIAPIYNPSIRHLQPVDKEELQIRYGEAKSAPTPAEPPVPVPVPGATPIVIENIVTQGDKKWQSKTTLTRVV
jgi:hypothetical protein